MFDHIAKNCLQKSPLILAFVISVVCTGLPDHAYAGCLEPLEVRITPGEYEPGNLVPVSVTLRCSGEGACISCSLVWLLGGGCGTHLSEEFFAGLSPGETATFNSFVPIPEDTEAGTYQICVRENCSGCFSLCNTCCTCCACSNGVIIIRALGDVNNDGNVNVNDLSEVILNWGSCGKNCGDNCPADLDNNCMVNLPDLMLVIENWS